MAGPAQPSTDAKSQSKPSTDPSTEKKAPAAAAPLEEDDEFEDFPVEDWTQEDSNQPDAAAPGATTHLWEESWDDDDTSEDFAVQLKEELKKLGHTK